MWSGASANVHVLYPVLALVLSVFAIAPLAFPGFFQSYTGYSAIYNLIELNRHLANVWAWSPTWGRAYDFLRMDGPLGYWLAELLHLAGVSFLDAVKLAYALAFLVGSYGMFRLAQRVLASAAAGLLAAALYTYFPAHLAAVYVRGAFGEAVAWSLFPLALWAVVTLEASDTRTRNGLIGCAAAFAALTLAQPGMAILFGIFARIWLLVLGPRPRGRGVFRSPAANALVLGLVSGIVIQLPALLPQRALSAANGFVPAFVHPFQLLTASWGTALPGTNVPLLSSTSKLGNLAAAGSAAGEAPYQIGFAALGLTIAAAALMLSNKSGGSSLAAAQRVLWFGILSSAVVAVLMLPLLAPLWAWSGLDLFVQYPFQLLAFIGIGLCLAAASVVVADVRLQAVPLLAALVIVPPLAVYPYLAPEFFNLNPTQPALARLNNDEIALLDAKIVRPPGVWRHGATVELDLTWQALRQPNRDYTVFLHILDAQGNEWGATDEKPQGGTLSTLNWQPGRVISDTHRVQISLDGPPEGYYMELGIYAAATGERAVTETGATEIRIEEQSP